MKTVLHFIALLSLVFMFQHCEEENFAKPTATCFLFLPNTEQEVLQLTDDSRIFVTISDERRIGADRHLQLDFTKEGGAYISQNVNLLPGRYRLTKFAVGNAKERLYRAQSALAFSVNPGVRNNIHVDLKKVKEKLIRFQLGVLNEDGQYISATATIRDGTTLIETFAVPPGINTFSFFGDRTVSYPIEIVKESYAKYEGEVVYKESFKDPIVVTLQPAFTFRIFVTDERKESYKSVIDLSSGTINIDFGDGTNQTYTKPEWTGGIFTHAFPSEGYYFITITGDLDSILVFRPNYLWSEYDQFDLTHLSSLKVFSIGVTPNGPSVIDLRNNSKLEEVYLSGIENLSQVLLPESHHIFGFGVDGPNSITTSGIDAIITNLYDNIVSKNIRSGQLYLTLDWHNPPTGLDFIGSPSPDAIEKVYSIHDDYGWLVNPIDSYE